MGKTLYGIINNSLETGLFQKNWMETLIIQLKKWQGRKPTIGGIYGRQ